MRQKDVHNPRYPHTVVITRMKPCDEDDESGMDEYEVLYMGPGHSFTDTTTNGDAREMVNMRKTSIPMRYDMWLKELLPNDAITVYIGKYKEEGVIRDFEPDNDRTLIYWDYGRL